MKTTTIQPILLLFLLLLTLGTQRTQLNQHDFTGQSSAKRPVTIPVEITSYGGIVLQAQINNSQPLSLWVDSGSTFPFVIGTKKATALGLKLKDHVLGAGAWLDAALNWACGTLQNRQYDFSVAVNLYLAR